MVVVTSVQPLFSESRGTLKMKNTQQFRDMQWMHNYGI